MHYSRKFFIGSCIAAGASAGCASFRGALSSRPIAKIGVVSDVHLREPGDEGSFIKAFEYFRDNGADGVMLAGDIADTGRIDQLRRAADSWFKVFPGGKAPDGRKVEQLFIYGNHDRWGWTSGLSREQMKDPAALVGAIGASREIMKKAWEDCFHEEFSPVWMKHVNGIAVVGAHWGFEDDHSKDMERFFAEKGRTLDPHLPFLYTQHDHPKDTCFGPWAWGHDDGTSTRVLSAFPNAVALSGHSHYTLTDERTVWQGAFTSINAGSLKCSSTDYACRENASGNSSGYGGENRRHAMPRIRTDDGRQGMLVSVFADRLEIERREFVFGERLGDDWIVPIPADGTFSYARRAAGRSAPAFAKDAKVEVAPADGEKGERKLVVRFPSARAVDGCRVNEYEVTATLVEDDFDLVQAQRRVLAADFHLPASKCGGGNSCAFFVDELPKKGRYVFSVRPVECFGKKGAAIASVPVAVL